MSYQKSWSWRDGQRKGVLYVDEDSGELVVEPDDDHYSGRISAQDTELLAHEILDRLTSQRDFQGIVAYWVRSALGEESLFDVHERCMRFGEESIELVQATGKVSREELHKLVDYVYDRPSGVIEQELGGTMVTLKALASGLDLNAEQALKDELHRILDPMATEKIQKKQAEKEAAGVGKTWKKNQ